MTPSFWLRYCYRPALSLLPARMDSQPAAVLCLATCLHESAGLRHRRQLGDGPARGYPQFERIAVVEVMTHRATRDHDEAVRRALDYFPLPDAAKTIHEALADNDILAAVFTRLNYWRMPSALPTEEEAAWRYYVATWRPGAVTEGGERADAARARWPSAYGRAVEAVQQEA